MTVLAFDRSRHPAPRVDDIRRSDLAFFKRHPDRRYRVRTACVAELDHAFSGRVPQIPPGRMWYGVVRLLAPGVTIRALVFAARGQPTGEMVSDAVAKGVYEEATTPGTVFAELERQILEQIVEETVWR